jgi:hypothetical protein
LLTGMLLVIALVFGRQVLHWWHEDSTPRSKAPAGGSSSAAPASSGDSQVLAFGNQNWSIRRQEFAGRRADVAAALTAFCRTVIAAAAPRGEAADAAEQDVLNRLAAEKPIAEEPGRWRLYRWSDGFPILIGTRATPDDLPTADGRTILAEPPYRVVIWGIGVPTVANHWNLYVFQAGGAGSASEQDASHVPLPPGCRRLATVREAGSSITAFSASDASGDSARRFYDRWFAGHGWTAAVPWQQISAGWHARFESAAGTPRTAADIRLGGNPQGQCTGLVMESQEK